MEAFKTTSRRAWYLEWVTSTMRMLTIAVVALAALFATGFLTEAEAQSSSIVVRARGTAGGESITLRVDNSNVATWTLTTSYQTYSVSTSLTGGITVAFTNDGGSRDVQVDYIIVNGETRQSENQSYNTGLWANGSCGGGSNSEWMHCNGAIGYGPVSNSANSIAVRARGTVGDESISLRIDDTEVATWTLTTSFQDLTASTNLTGAITVAFTNDDGGSRDVEVDYIVVNGETRQAEDQSYNTAFYTNGSCGGGGYSQWMHCNGVIGFGNVEGGGGGPGQLPAFFVGNITTNGNGGYGVVVVGQVHTALSGITTTADQAGGLRINRSTDVHVSGLSATDQPAGVFVHVGSARIALDHVRTSGGRRGVVVE